jgi:hypothetical protein
MASKKKPIITINPREPLTRKAREAIELYADLKAERTGKYQHFMVEFILKAERMKRAQLYAILEEYGFRWKPPYWQIRDINGRLHGGYCPPELRPKKGRLS